jgi:uncharacterized protein YdgA (DUF945 family)
MLKKYYRSLCAIALLTMLALTPYFTGVLIQKEYLQDIELAASSMKLTVLPLSYHRGWLHSDVTLATPLPLTDQPLAMKQGQALYIRQRIYHGPFIFYHNQSKTGFALALAHIDSFIEPHVLFAQTTVAFNKDLTTHLELPHYQLMRQNHLLYSLNDLKGTIYSRGKAFTSVSILLKNFYGNFDNQRQIVNFVMSSELKQNQTGIWMGKRNYHFDLLTWWRGEEKYALKDINLTSNTLPTAQFVTLAFNGAIKSVIVNNQNYGPAQVAISLKARDGQELKAVQQYLMIAAAEKTANFQRQLKALLNKGASFTIQLSLNTAWGQMAINANVAYPQHGLAPNMIAGKLPLEVANRLLTNYYLLRHGEVAKAHKSAEDTLLAWQKNGFVAILGPQVYLSLRW